MSRYEILMLIAVIAVLVAIAAVIILPMFEQLQVCEDLGGKSVGSSFSICLKQIDGEYVEGSVRKINDEWVWVRK